MIFDIEAIHIAYFILFVFITGCVVLSYYADLSKNEKSEHYQKRNLFLYSAIGCGILILFPLYAIYVYHKNRMERPLPPSNVSPFFPMRWEKEMERIREKRKNF